MLQGSIRDFFKGKGLVEKNNKHEDDSGIYINKKRKQRIKSFCTQSLIPISWMKSKWIIHKLNSHSPSWTSSFSSPFKTQIHHSQKSSTFLLNNLDITLLLSICGREGYFHLGTSLHASVIKTPEFFSPENQNHYTLRNVIGIWNSLLAMYSRCGALSDAVQLFDNMPVKDTVSWNSMISGSLRNGEFGMGIRCFKLMQKLGSFRFDQATLTTILSVCDRTEFSNVSKMIHCLAVLCGFEREMRVGNALITSYLKCRCYNSGMRVFDEMIEKNVVTWTAAISGLAQHEMYEDSLKMFVKMSCGSVEPNLLTYLSSLMACSGLQALREGCQIHGRVLKLGIQSDLCVESALMDMYSKCGSMEDAWRIFESAAELDEVSMTVILVGFAQNGFEEEAIQLFEKMVKAGVEVDPNMTSAVLGVFGVYTSLSLGKQIHSMVIKLSFGSNLFVVNGLINMYSKCGDLEDSIKLFNRMPWRNSVSWNSMIATFARHGDCSRAVQFYEYMRLEGVQPTDVTFLSLLHACSHAGLIEKGMELLKSMTEIYKIPPRSEHFTCVVDMLGRAGLLNEAKEYIDRLSVKPDTLVWQALLGACGIHGDAEMGKHAAEQLLLSTPEKAAPYILLANIYSSGGRWKERAKIIKKMKEMGVAKETGTSWIEIDQKVHSFVVGDKMHPQTEIIYEVLLQLFGLMTDEGYMPDDRFVLYYIDQDGIE